jgi:transglutaminase-like putative cysteine protease
VNDKKDGLKRREFLWMSGLAVAGLAGGKSLLGADTSPAAWRTFELVTRVEVLQASGITRVWVPAPLVNEMPYQRTLSNEFTADGGSARLVTGKAPDALGIITAEFPAGVKPVLVVTSRVATRDHSVSFAARATGEKSDRATLRHFLRPTSMLPTDGIVRETARLATKSARTDLDKARAIYEWIVDNTFRDPKVRGCGIGDIRSMLETRNLGGKCADLNTLYVGLARAAGLPARDVYGIRMVPSRRGYKSLGASSAMISKSQHCRAEVYVDGRGWIPVDPADVRKVVLEEPPGNRSLDDEMVLAARRRLFGSWEMNWVAYNFAHDVALPGARFGTIPFLMYPQAETDEGRLDSLDPDHFKYEITSRELTA